MKVKIWLLTAFCVICFSVNFFSATAMASAQPFYGKTGKCFTLRGSFYTSLNSSQTDRVHNVKLACQKIDGTFLESGDTFSFNNIVGARTEKRGFRTAKIILGGRFVDGVGGGVCQVSTTLYNAVLLSGLKVVEQHPHSLAVGYVEPSFDAMVNSSFADLKFINDTLSPVYIKAYCDGKTVKIEIYGERLDDVIVKESEIISTVPAPSPEVIEDDGSYNLNFGEEKFIIYPKDGLKSQGYLCVYRNKKLLKKTLIRKDFYRPQQGVIVKCTAERLPISTNEHISTFGMFSQYRYALKTSF